MRLIDADKILEDVYPVEIMIVDKIRNAPTVDFGVDLDRIKELTQADKEGRCLVLPCKVGDVLYKSTRTFVSSFKVAFIEVSMCNCLFIHTNLISGINMTGEIFKEDDIGKSVFLTEEEAEKALEGLE